MSAARLHRYFSNPRQEWLLVFPRGLTILFLKDFAVGLWLMFPLVFSLIGAIILLGQTVGRRHGWSFLDTVYWSFMTATTVGYGDLRPTDRRSKIVAIVIAFLGLILTGIVIAVAVQATTRALTEVRR
jgi:voltage-gated potassium channel